MRPNIMAVSGLAILLASAWVLPVVAQEESKGEKAEKKSEELAKAKAEKVSGDIGLLDTEKNYMTIRRTLTPGAGLNSYIVMTGPGRTATTSPSTPKSSSFFCRIIELA